jgi:thymidylate kinase
MIIAFMGNDGSGKTALARSVESKLRELTLDVRYYRAFDHRVLGCLLRIIPSKRLDESRKKFLTRRNRKSFVFRVWPYVVFLDCVLTYLELSLLRKREVAILDRYFYDFLMSYEYLGCSGNLVRRLFLLLPRPDIGFLLDVPPEVASQRKAAGHDVDINYYEVQRRRYIELAAFLGIKVIDTRSPLAHSTDEALDEIKSRLGLTGVGLS